MFTLGPPMWGGAVTDPYAGNVLGLLHFNEADGASLPAASLGTATVSNDGSGSAPTSNAVKAASARFGAGGWLSAGGSTGLKLSQVTSSSTLYTIEFFVKFNSFGSFGRFFGAASGGVDFSLSASGGTIRYVDITATDRSTTGVVSLSTWYHFAICSDGASVFLYQDGAQIFASSTYWRGLSSTTVNLGLGCSVGMGGADGEASFDEFRWTHGANRYPSGLTTPTAEFPNS